MNKDERETAADALPSAAEGLSPGDGGPHGGRGWRGQHGIQLLVKTFLMLEGIDPQTLIQGDLTQQGISYEVSNILRQNIPGDVEKKTVSKGTLIRPLVQTHEKIDFRGYCALTMDTRMV